jgi:hypothetical protein
MSLLRFHGCGSAVGADRAPADDWSSSIPVVRCRRPRRSQARGMHQSRAKNGETRLGSATSRCQADVRRFRAGRNRVRSSGFPMPARTRPGPQIAWLVRRSPPRRRRARRASGGGRGVNRLAQRHARGTPQRVGVGELAGARRQPSRCGGRAEPCADDHGARPSDSTCGRVSGPATLRELPDAAAQREAAARDARCGHGAPSTRCAHVEPTTSESQTDGGRST